MSLLEDESFRKELTKAIYEDRRRPLEPYKPVEPKGEPITSFRGPYRFLSNFHECPIQALDLEFGSTEAAYHAAKRIDDRDFHRKLAGMRPAAAMEYGRSLPITTPDWHLITKFQVMRVLIEQKFSDDNLRWMLLGTKERHLEEGNSHGDTVWGTDNSKPVHPLIAEITDEVYQGQNHLGKILMDTRRMLKLGDTGLIQSRIVL